MEMERDEDLEAYRKRYLDNAMRLFKPYTVEDIKKNPMLIRYAEKQTPEMCWVAVRMNWETLDFIIDQTRELCLFAIQQHHFAYQNIKDPTREMALATVRKNGRMLIAMANMQDEELCLEAIKQDPTALKFVINQTDKICKLALHLNPSVEKDIRNRNEIPRYKAELQELNNNI
jgi:hypothetical protein